MMTWTKWGEMGMRPDLLSSSIAATVIKLLSEYEPYILSQSKDGLSIYIKFANLPHGLDHQLRISNHNERQCYGSKWQLRTDGLPHVQSRKEWSRYFTNIIDLVSNFRAYYTKVQSDINGHEQATIERLQRRITKAKINRTRAGRRANRNTRSDIPTGSYIF